MEYFRIGEDLYRWLTFATLLFFCTRSKYSTWIRNIILRTNGLGLRSAFCYVKRHDCQLPSICYYYWLCPLSPQCSVKCKQSSRTVYNATDHTAFANSGRLPCFAPVQGPQIITPFHLIPLSSLRPRCFSRRRRSSHTSSPCSLLAIPRECLTPSSPPGVLYPSIRPRRWH